LPITGRPECSGNILLTATAPVWPGMGMGRIDLAYSSMLSWPVQVRHLRQWHDASESRYTRVGSILLCLVIVPCYCALNINADKWPVPPMRKTNKRAISRSFRGCGYNRLRTLCSTPILDGCRLPGRLRQLPCHQARAAIDTGSALMGSGRPNRTARTWQRDCLADRSDVVRALSGKVNQRMNTRLAPIGKSAVQHRLPPRQTRNPIAAACAGNSNHL